jgi:predicted transcriptional regulator
LIKDRGLSAHAFAVAAGIRPATYIYKILRNSRSTPARHLHGMAQALELSDQERRAFFLLALADHIPADLQDFFAQGKHGFTRADITVAAELANRLASAKTAVVRQRRVRRPAP